MFTVKGLIKKKIQRPPVKGCRCTYCENMLTKGYGCKGANSMPSHRLRGGNEHHNPENYGRLLLKQLVTPKQFKEYVSFPGGNTLTWKGKSGLWYTSGRIDNGGDIGHYIDVFCRRPKKYYESVASICIPLVDDSVPLVDIVMAHYLACTAEEAYIWRTGTVEIMNEGYDEDGEVNHKIIPEKLYEVVEHFC